MDCVVTPLKTLMGFSVHLNVQFKFYNLPKVKSATKLLYIGFSFDDEQRTAVILNLQSATTVLLFKVLNKL